MYVVAARTNLVAKATHGLSLFLVDRAMAGFRVGRKLEKMGWRSSDTAELVFEDCRVPAENLLGEEDRGFYAIMKNVQNERLVLGAQAMGEALAAIEMTIAYVKERRAFAGTLWDKQVIRQRLAVLSARVEAARHFIYSVAGQDAQGVECVKEVSMIKALCGELVNEVMYACLQFHGGYGFIRETAIERMYRDARVHSIGGGATEVMLDEVAKRFAP